MRLEIRLRLKLFAIALNASVSSTARGNVHHPRRNLFVTIYRVNNIERTEQLARNFPVEVLWFLPFQLQSFAQLMDYIMN